MRWFAAASGFAEWAKTTPANAATRPAGILESIIQMVGPVTYGASYVTSECTS